MILIIPTVPGTTDTVATQLFNAKPPKSLQAVMLKGMTAGHKYQRHPSTIFPSWSKTSKRAEAKTEPTKAGPIQNILDT